MIARSATLAIEWTWIFGGSGGSGLKWPVARRKQITKLHFEHPNVNLMSRERGSPTKPPATRSQFSHTLHATRVDYDYYSSVVVAVVVLSFFVRELNFIQANSQPKATRLRNCTGRRKGNMT